MRDGEFPDPRFCFWSGERRHIIAGEGVLFADNDGILLDVVGGQGKTFAAPQAEIKQDSGKSAEWMCFTGLQMLRKISLQIACYTAELLSIRL